MKKFIIITKEGKTKPPNETIEINNMQVLGIVENVIDENEALKTLLKDNPWIWESGFNVAEFVVYEIL